MSHPSPPVVAAGSAAGEAELESLLVAGEVVAAVARQHRLYALTRRRGLAAATSGRFIFMTRRLLGGFDPIGVRWQDLKEVGLTVGMVSATLTVVYEANLSDTASGEGGTRVIRAAGFERVGAAALYRICQGQEQAWREKRRIRSLEEIRAQASGVQIAGGGGAPPGAEIAAIAGDPTERLERAREMRTRGLITDAEYEAIKARIVGAL